MRLMLINLSKASFFIYSMSSFFSFSNLTRFFGLCSEPDIGSIVER